MLPGGSALFVKDQLDNTVSLDRCLAQTRIFTDLTLATEDGSRNNRIVCQEIRCKDGRGYSFIMFFRSIGEVFPLTPEGHIDVRVLVAHPYFFKTFRTLIPVKKRICTSKVEKVDSGVL